MTACDSNIHRTEYGPLALGDLAATREKGIASTRQVLSDWVARWDLVCPAQPRHNDDLALWDNFKPASFWRKEEDDVFWGVSQMGGDRADLAWEAVEKHLRCCTLPSSFDMQWWRCFISLLCCRKMGASAIEMQKQHNWNDYFPRWLITWDEWLLLNFPSFQISFFFFHI